MKIVIIGGTGLIGSNVARRLVAAGHDVLAASPSTGVDTITGAGLAEALKGADVVVDVANSPNFEDNAVMEFFRTSCGNVMAAEKNAGVRHHVALSIVGADRIPDSGYMRAKVAQEELIKAAGVPYTIVRATQFFEFASAIAHGGARGDAVHLPPAMMQPIAADDVSAAVAEAAIAEPVNGSIDIAGPEKIRQDDLARRLLAAEGDVREVITDPEATYFGAAVTDTSLVPLGEAHLGKTTFADWLAAHQAA
ncbi:SDR family oxidoreductase [Catellatospora sichuanensis]|uniref:SDR family oxidoreductase n=1 Tax=Catellatospora sichuanensis TaxID=1969805 RepID=UPI0011824AC7|nr:SDR family oxidoreductase [Catellatospora sichuanensis]